MLRTCLCVLLAPVWSFAPGRAPPPRMAVEAATRVSEKYGDTPPGLSLSAPCKINLFLRILRKRDDGYHELASLFQSVSLMDTLDFWVDEGDGDADAPLCSMEVSADSVSVATSVCQFDSSILAQRGTEPHRFNIFNVGWYDTSLRIHGCSRLRSACFGSESNTCTV